MVNKVSFPRAKMNIVLLEGIHPAAVELFHERGYSPKLISTAWQKDELLAAISDIHILGIRSRTEIPSDVLAKTKRLLSVGCFCIGTNQVDLRAAEMNGIPVFNAPFSNTRSVAELAMAEIIMLARKAAWKSQRMHQGVWDKSADGCCEIRHKVLGIIGYGHIGQQIGILAESFGMKVIYYDILRKLPLGIAQTVESINDLLKASDFVTLHVPETPETKGMIGSKELSKMKQGAVLLNLSRGTVVDIAALAEALRNGHLAGAALDVYPIEPGSNKDEFVSELRGIPNVLLTPHIGGSTEEAQKNIGLEVANSLLDFIETGATEGAVNFPKVALAIVEGNHRILNIHKNVPGVLGSINNIMAEVGANISAQYLSTTAEIGYLIMDINVDVSREVTQRIESLETSIKTRLLF